MRVKFVILAGAIASVPAVAAAQAVVAEPAQAAAQAPDDIIVTGEKADRTLKETTSSVAITTPKRIAEENLLTVQDIYSRTANVAEVYGGTGFTIRGVNNRGISGAGQADTSTVYLDGAPLPREALLSGPTDLWDIAQVEILRGPQSTIQGLNAIAGAVVINTVDPSFTWSGAARMLWTNQAERTFSGAIGGPIIDDQLAFRIAAERRADDGIISNVVRGGHDDKLRSLNLRAKLLLTPKALPDLTIQGSYNRVRRDGGYLYEYVDTSLPDYYDHRRSQSNAPNRADIATDIATLNISYRLSDAFKLTNVASFNREHADLMADGDFTPADRSTIHNVYTTKTWTDELRLNYSSGRLSGLLGGWFSDRDQQLNSDSRVNIATPAASIQGLLVGGGFPAAAAASITNAYVAQLPVIPVAYVGYQPTHVRTYALFGDGRYRLTDRLSLIAGFRWDNETNDSAASSIASFAGTYPDPAAFGAAGTALNRAITAINRGVAGLVSAASGIAPPDSRDFHAFLPKGGISMDWNAHLATAFTVQRGYRSGGESQNIARSTLVAYDPEYTTNYEGSLRSNWLGGRLTINANVFYTHWIDQQVTVFGNLSAYDYNTVNAGRSHLWGFEVEATHRFSKWVDAYANVGHVHTRFDDFKLPAGTALGTDLSGTAFPYAPKWTAAGGVNVRSAIGVVFNGNVNWRTGEYTDVGNPADFHVSGRAVGNVKLGYDQPHWGAFLYVRNIWNEHYKEYDYALIHQAVLGAPRTIGGELDMRF